MSFQSLLNRFKKPEGLQAALEAAQLSALDQQGEISKLKKQNADLRQLLKDTVYFWEKSHNETEAKTAKQVAEFKSVVKVMAFAGAELEAKLDPPAKPRTTRENIAALVESQTSGKFRATYSTARERIVAAFKAQSNKPTATLSR